MSKAVWAERLARKHYGPNDDSPLDHIAFHYAEGLKTEHARAVRVVKRLRRWYVERNKNGDTQAHIIVCDNILAALQKGRT